MKEQLYCTLYWDGKPGICTRKGMGWPRKAEMIFYGDYYKGQEDSPNPWPVDPETGEKLPMYKPKWLDEPDPELISTSIIIMGILVLVLWLIGLAYS